MSKSYKATLTEQIDHQYLPKFKEVYNALDERHRFTNYDDYEVVIKNSGIHENKQIDQNRLPEIVELTVYVNENL